MFEAHVDFHRAAEWMALLQEHGEGLSALVHPHTTSGGRVDHETHARWVNEKLDCDLTIFARM